MAAKEENIFEKFYGSYTLDLASAFWIFGVIVTTIAGLIFGYLSEAIHHWLILPYYYIMGLVEDICLTAASAYHRVNNCFSTVSYKGKIPQN